MIAVLLIIPLFLCWGSFLNVIAYRLIKDHSVIRPRSFCPSCKQPLAWYDMIPVISWIVLCGRCRQCKQPISWLYPFIEILTAVVMVALVINIPIRFIPAYFIFFSALIVTIRTDIETMLISRFVSFFLIPLGFLFAVFSIIPISPLDSILGSMLGYLAPYLFSKLFQWLTGREGIGSGDYELLAFIGSFTGIAGSWISLVIGSILGSLFGLLQLISGRADRFTKIPFGPFLALGSIIFVLFQDTIIRLIFGFAL